MDRNRTALALGSRLESVGGVHSSSAAGRVAAGLDGDEGGRADGPRLTSKTDTLACSATDANKLMKATPNAPQVLMQIATQRTNQTPGWLDVQKIIHLVHLACLLVSNIFFSYQINNSHQLASGKLLS